MGQVTNNQTFLVSSGVITTTVVTKFRIAMDKILISGPEVNIDLKPGRTKCPAVDCKFNPPYNKYMGTNNAICRSCKGQGFIFEPRWTVYKCNRRWANEPIEGAFKNQGRQATVAGQIYGNFVRIKTVVQSFNHIQQSIGATIDGLKVKLFQEPRITGFGGTNLYVISWWERANKKVSNG